MQNRLFLDEIFNKIKFKIQPNQNIRKEYLYRIKKKKYINFLIKKNYL